MTMDEHDAPGIAELHALADDLHAQAAEMRRQWSELAAVLGADLDAVDEGEVQAAAEHETARLVAIDMLLSGRPREEIEAYLRETFAAEDVPVIVDDVFARFTS